MDQQSQQLPGTNVPIETSREESQQWTLHQRSHDDLNQDSLMIQSSQLQSPAVQAGIDQATLLLVQSMCQEVYLNYEVLQPFHNDIEDTLQQRAMVRALNQEEDTAVKEEPEIRDSIDVDEAELEQRRLQEEMLAALGFGQNSNSKESPQRYSWDEAIAKVDKQEKTTLFSVKKPRIENEDSNRSQSKGKKWDFESLRKNKEEPKEEANDHIDSADTETQRLLQQVQDEIEGGLEAIKNSTGEIQEEVFKIEYSTSKESSEIDDYYTSQKQESINQNEEIQVQQSQELTVRDEQSYQSDQQQKRDSNQISEEVVVQAEQRVSQVSSELQQYPEQCDNDQKPSSRHLSQENQEQSNQIIAQTTDMSGIQSRKHQEYEEYSGVESSEEHPEKSSNQNEEEEDDKQRQNTDEEYEEPVHIPTDNEETPDDDYSEQQESEHSDQTEKQQNPSLHVQQPTFSSFPIENKIDPSNRSSVRDIKPQSPLAQQIQMFQVNPAEQSDNYSEQNEEEYSSDNSQHQPEEQHQQKDQKNSRLDKERPTFVDTNLKNTFKAPPLAPQPSKEQKTQPASSTASPNPYVTKKSVVSKQNPLDEHTPYLYPSQPEQRSHSQLSEPVNRYAIIKSESQTSTMSHFSKQQRVLSNLQKIHKASPHHQAHLFRLKRASLPRLKQNLIGQSAGNLHDQSKIMIVRRVPQVSERHQSSQEEFVNIKINKFQFAPNKLTAKRSLREKKRNSKSPKSYKSSMTPHQNYSHKTLPQRSYYYSQNSTPEPRQAPPQSNSVNPYDINNVDILNYAQSIMPRYKRITKSYNQPFYPQNQKNRDNWNSSVQIQAQASPSTLVYQPALDAKDIIARQMEMNRTVFQQNEQTHLRNLQQIQEHFNRKSYEELRDIPSPQRRENPWQTDVGRGFGQFRPFNSQQQRGYNSFQAQSHPSNIQVVRENDFEQNEYGIPQKPKAQERQFLTNQMGFFPKIQENSSQPHSRQTQNSEQSYFF